MKKLIACIIFSMFATGALAAGSSSVSPALSKDIKHYNNGVKLMLDKEFADAEKEFRRALDVNESFAEAHNNLAYTLRKQGADHFDEALQHYNRAIELNPRLAEPYMYRGVLYVQMGDKTAALADHQTLVNMKSPLAPELEYVVVNGREKEPEQFFGVSREMD
jgi:tetratricopeptide (TPR) repeat protein